MAEGFLDKNSEFRGVKGGRATLPSQSSVLSICSEEPEARADGTPWAKRYNEILGKLLRGLPHMCRAFLHCPFSLSLSIFTVRELITQQRVLSSCWTTPEVVFTGSRNLCSPVFFWLLTLNLEQYCESYCGRDNTTTFINLLVDVTSQ